MRGLRVAVLVGVAASVLFAGSAHAAGKARTEKAEEAREYLDKATAAFALNRYAVAAENYEKSFELKPDAAVLYNAAQAYRLAGNKERALDLYQSYLRMYGDDKRAEIEKHIQNLKQAIEKDHAVATSPPTGTAPVGVAPAGSGAAAGSTMVTPPPPAAGSTMVAPPPPAAGSTMVAAPPPPAAGSTMVAAPPPSVPGAPPPAQPAPVLVAQPAPASDQSSVVSKPWFWIAVGGVVAAAVVTSILVAGRRDPSDPTSTITPVDGN